ncbi:hypothetical protein KJ068_20940 [bacterium]|nr:hypothetical protein [bacterium]
MTSLKLNRPRFVTGLILLAVAALMFLYGHYSTAGVVAIGVLGLISIATSRKK